MRVSDARQQLPMRVCYCVYVAYGDRLTILLRLGGFGIEWVVMGF